MGDTSIVIVKASSLYSCVFIIYAFDSGATVQSLELLAWSCILVQHAFATVGEKSLLSAIAMVQVWGFTLTVHGGVLEFLHAT